MPGWYLSAVSTARRRFLYGSNRGDDSVGRPANRQACPVDYTPCGGATPRNLALTPSGSHLLSANQNADRISIFACDAATGRLADTGRSIDVARRCA
ncbi:beta-propeller fold lactonase family protein [Mesorhizobium sp.]|uniref:lactonase family protein n=1 Tax=Mesorhizobium sp. TaxID=1871066 RepID=UPI0026007030|nr:beta-propeller fold lactonase family protein [Mesorhizobium sp.]